MGELLADLLPSVNAPDGGPIPRPGRGCATTPARAINRRPHDDDGSRATGAAGAVDHPD
jgi:hypothetical protein